MKRYPVYLKEMILEKVFKGEPVVKIAKDYRISRNTIYTWVKRYKEHPEDPFVGTGNLHKNKAKETSLKKHLKNLQEENSLLKAVKEVLEKKESSRRIYPKEQEKPQLPNLDPYIVLRPSKSKEPDLSLFDLDD